jgi:tetratricopeptide (TPR) repeat protein
LFFVAGPQVRDYRPPVKNTKRSVRWLLVGGSLAAFLGFVGAGCTPPGGAVSPQATRSYAAGVLAYERGEIPAAQMHLGAATRQSPVLIKARTLLGDLFRAEGNYVAALDEYEVVVKLDPNSPSGFYRLGLVYQLLQRFLEARDAYTRALTLNPNDASSHMNLGLVHLALGDLVAAVEHTSKAVELAPTNPDTLANHGVVLDAVGDKPGAERAFLSSLELAGDRPATLLNLAQNLLAQGRPTEAEQVLRRLLASVETPMGRKRLGDALAMQGRAADAIEQYELAIKRDPRFFPAYNEAGRVMIQRYRAGGELDEDIRKAALGYWRNSLRINPAQPAIEASVRQWELTKP